MVMTLIEIDGLPFLIAWWFSMAKCECHNQIVLLNWTIIYKWRIIHAMFDYRRVVWLMVHLWFGLFDVDLWYPTESTTFIRVRFLFQSNNPKHWGSIGWVDARVDIVMFVPMTLGSHFLKLRDYESNFHTGLFSSQSQGTVFAPQMSNASNCSVSERKSSRLIWTG